MLVILTPEQALDMRQARFEKLAPGKIFSLSRFEGDRTFIAIEKLGERVEVIELDAEKIKRIVRGESCVRSILHFHEMDGLYVRDN